MSADSDGAALMDFIIADAASATGSGKDHASGDQTQDRILWLELGLCKALVRAVSHLGFIAPTPVQAAAIPAAMSGADVCARAVTGSGKTAAFVLPMLHLLVTRAPAWQSAMGSKRQYIRAIILVPSRELGVQCCEMVRQLMRFTSELRIGMAIGGMSAAAQEAALQPAPDVLVATPGRLVDLLHNPVKPGSSALDLSGIELFIMDECDKLLTVTLKDQVEDIVQRIPEATRQMLLFSATMTAEVDEFAKACLFEPKNVDIGHIALASQLRQQFVRIQVSEEDLAVTQRAAQRPERPRKRRPVDEDADSDAATDSSSSSEESGDAAAESTGKAGKRRGHTRTHRKERRQQEQEDVEAAERNADLVFGASPTGGEHISKIKTRYLVALCQQYFKDHVLIFTKYRTTTHRLQKVFEALHLPCAELQGNQLQEERFDALRRFTNGDVSYLFCTDVASRGLDIKCVKTVLNFDLPPTLTAYIHRVGRTARIGAEGTAVSLVHETIDADIMRKILTLSGNINDHQVSSVKRRDVPEEYLLQAKEAVDSVFPVVRDLLAAEEVEAKIVLAEKIIQRGTRRQEVLQKRYDMGASAAEQVARGKAGQKEASIADVLTAGARKTWCLSRAERQERETEARRVYEKEAEVTMNHMAGELAELDREANRFLKQQKGERRVERQKKERLHQRDLDKIKEQRQKAAKKVQAGAVKKLKQRKVREARKAARAANRESKGRPAFVRKDRKSAKKSRHRKSMKKH